jgi:hypothetical protein
LYNSGKKVQIKQLTHKGNKYQAALNSLARQNRLINNEPARIEISSFARQNDKTSTKRNKARSLFSYDAQHTQLWGIVKRELMHLKNWSRDDKSSLDEYAHSFGYDDEALNMLLDSMVTSDLITNERKNQLISEYQDKQTKP